jgi:hypothetical protein
LGTHVGDHLDGVVSEETEEMLQGVVGMPDCQDAEKRHPNPTAI